MARSHSKLLLKLLVEKGFYSARIQKAYESNFVELDPLKQDMVRGDGLLVSFYATNILKKPVPHLERVIPWHFGVVSHYLTYFPQREAAVRAEAEKVAPVITQFGLPMGEDRYWRTFNSSVNTAKEQREHNLAEAAQQELHGNED